MTSAVKESWTLCPKPAAGDIIRWREPLWDKPNKPRGKPDKIGEQLVTAKMIVADALAELEVIEVKHRALAPGFENTPVKISKGDIIRRKMTSIKSGECQKLSQELSQEA